LRMVALSNAVRIAVCLRNQDDTIGFMRPSTNWNAIDSSTQEKISLLICRMCPRLCRRTHRTY